MTTATTTTMSTARPEQTNKQPRGFKKVIKYFQDQALEYSPSKVYLTPPGQEPQQRVRHRPHIQQQRSQEVSRTLSDATTAVDRNPRLRASPGSGSVAQRPNAAMANRSSSAMSQFVKKIQYATENLLQSYEIYEPDPPSEDTKPEQYWILFIHGGYFRDPKVDAMAFRPALELLTAKAPSITEESETGNTQAAETEFFSIQHHIAGYASINYRLSPHEAYPQDPAATPNYEMRNAKWPDQLNDIHTAIKHLESRHHFGGNYILSGHSVGATLAFVAALHAKDAGIQPPKCVVGLNGIYDFPAIHRSNPDYETMTRNAMKPEQYREASPALYSSEAYSRVSEAGTKHFLISHSRDDGLVAWDQAEFVEQALENAKHDGNYDVRHLETHGQHDEIWSQGKELARTLKQAINMVVDS